MNNWDPLDSDEVRRAPKAHEVYNFIRHELDKRDAKLEQLLDRQIDKLDQQINKLSAAHGVTSAKVTRWENGAVLLRWVTLVAIGAIGGGAAFLDWAKEHYRW